MYEDGNPVDTTPEEDSGEFDSGFETDETEESAAPQEPASTPVQEPLPEQRAEEPTPEEEPEEPASSAPAPAPAEEPAPRKVELPEELQTEWEELKARSPRAAELALEDSAEGERVRRFMSEYGAFLAQDKAETLLDARDRAAHLRRAEEERSRRAVEEHNKHFYEVLRREHPDIAEMGADPSRRAESKRLMKEIDEWIKSKPYREAEPMLRIARSGGAEEVCGLLSRFKRERAGGTAQRGRGPEGAYAVPGRGAASAPSDAGDMDDFDAGFEL